VFFILSELLSFNGLGHLFATDWKVIRKMEIDYWKGINVNTMEPEQIIDYFKWSNSSACQYRHYFGGEIQNWSLTGMDGQYPVCLDQAVRPISSKRKRCIVYSFGINDEWSFEDAMEKYGCEVFAFDPSMKKEDHDHSVHIHFYNIGLGDGNYTDSNNWKLMTLDSVYQMLVPRHGDTIIDFLKIDIEWNEWTCFKQILKSGMLEKVRQLSVEFHLPNKIESAIDKYLSIEDYRSLVGLVKLIEHKMTRFEARANPWATKRIENLNNYNGSICFELSFYQILSRNN
jgi:hypothetical protein